MKATSNYHHYLLGALALCTMSCGHQDRGASTSDNSIGGTRSSFENQWTEGMPEIRGQVPELHLSVSPHGIYDPQHPIQHNDEWAGMLEQAKNMNPKPLLILSADRNLAQNLRRAAMERLGQVYACQPYKCFVVGAQTASK